MRRVSLRNLVAHKVRLLLTVLSVVLGTAFVAGSFIFTDTLQSTFNGIFEDTAQGVDVRVQSEEARSSGVPLSDVEAIRAVPGVRTVQVAVSTPVVLLDSAGDPVQGGGAPSMGEAYVADDQRIGDPLPFLSGRPPAAAGEIALNQGAADNAGLAPGDRTKVLVPAQGTVDVVISGIYDTEADTGGYVGALFTSAQARQLFTDGNHVTWVDVAGAGLSQEEVRDRVAQALPGLKVQTGDQVRADTQAEVNQALSFVNYFLLAFGAIALLVGTFIIYNTFSMIVAQRLRELALLRAIGASRRQLSRSVILEAVVVGLVGSVVGLAAGVGLAYGLRSLLNSFNLGLPEGSLQLAPRTVVVALVVGVVVTVISAYAPARRASRIPPVQAMREEFASTGTSLRGRTIVAAVVGVLGVAAVGAGAASTGGGAASLVGLGALLLIVAVLLGAPAFSQPVIGALGAPLRGPVGRLARTNAVRNPRRTAATAFALTLGLMLVSAIGMFGASAKASLNSVVDNDVTADYVLSGPDMIGVPYAASDTVQPVPGVGQVVAVQNVRVQIDGADELGAAVDGDPGQVMVVDAQQGDVAVTGTDMAVSETAAQSNGWRMGDTVALTSPDGRTVPTTVTGVYADNQLLGDWVVSEQVYRDVTPAQEQVHAVVLVKAAPGADLATLRTGLEQATDPLLVVQVQDREQFKGSLASQIDTLLAVLYGLLALAIVIAVLGIINTLALSVVERRREIGMLRAVGMQRAQVRRNVYLESMLIAIFGALVGVALGLGFGWAFVRTLRDSGLGEVAVPWTQVVIMLVGSAVVGVLAALWPASRAARTRPLDAITGG
ncbi:FtsX-like permease family protein [Rhodococcus sp. X156]|uniref:ABC transporter permease n=1 Tax=Rhodococcus sp. X156 TaxID=2499145 RepID=UPI000FDAB419|nr:FtsX-like permease family protein [Rhodococcus sp. X156]